MIPLLGPRDPFPPADRALEDPNGLLAAGADLSTDRLLDAYSRGIFPWFDEGDPILWWSPDPRMILETASVHVSRSLGKTIRSGRFRVTMDEDFAGVVAGCAEPRAGQDGTWITSDMTAAYVRLFEMGHAHSVETWIDGRLAGGLYGVALGRMFFGESMFSRTADASKVALVGMARQLSAWGCPMVDCQMATGHLASLGAREVPRSEFLRRIRPLVRASPAPSPWRFGEEVLATMNRQGARGSKGERGR